MPSVRACVAAGVGGAAPRGAVCHAFLLSVVLLSCSCLAPLWAGPCFGAGRYARLARTNTDECFLFVGVQVAFQLLSS
ncbi:hypothetical protein T484DRAFT_1927082 [Baffinella frigidus]|nr:hypothetical protein T484DRAFT_1927082 [Cryptophyta sp. CCMP2293]